MAPSGPVRWLHVPKAGTPFVRTACVYGCSLGAHTNVSSQQLDAELRGYINISPAYESKGSFCPQEWETRNGGSCAAGLIQNPEHVPIAPKEVGTVLAMFRHPRSRVASSCRQWAPHDFTDEWYAHCMAEHFMRHNSVQTRLVAGESCGGGESCNGVVSLPPVRTEWVHTALERMPSAFLFIGLTDAWGASIEIFHARLTPGVAVLQSELQLGHSSKGNARSSRETLWRQERAARLLYHNATPRGVRDAMELDSDLLLYARARTIFCRDYESHRLRSDPPEECAAALGPSPVGPQQELAARVVAHWRAVKALIPVVAGMSAGSRIMANGRTMLPSPPAASAPAPASGESVVVPRQLTYLSAPKVGSAFSTTIFRYACPHAPEWAVADPDWTQLWPPLGLHHHFNSSNCDLSAIAVHGVHTPARYPHDARLPARLVSLFREPHRRLRSCWNFIAADMLKTCGRHGNYSPLLIAVLETHGFPRPEEYIRHFEHNNCSTPIGWLTSDGMLPIVMGVQTKTLLGIPLQTNLSARGPNALASFPASVDELVLSRLRASSALEGGLVDPADHTPPSFWADAAIARVRNSFAFVGLTEHYAASVCLFHARFLGGAPVLAYERVHSHNHAQALAAGGRDQETESTREIIPVDEYDTPLYEMVAARFQSEVSDVPACKELLVPQQRRLRHSGSSERVR